MKQRHEQILGEIVRAYLHSGRPVGSRMLAEKGGIELSPASIRNVMAELERLGYLYAPHTSAGRLPTDAGLRYFVDTLMVVDPSMRQHLEHALADRLRDLDDRNKLLQRASDELANLTHFAGLVYVHERTFHAIRKIELVPVTRERVLAVIITDTGEVQNRLVSRPPGSSDQDLHEIASRLNELLHDCDLDEARRRLRRAMELDRQRIRVLLEDLKRWAESPTEDVDNLYIRGQGQLLEMPEFEVIETVRSLLSAFEEKKHLLQLIEQVEREGNGVKVFIGSEHALVNMEEVSVVLSRYQGEGNLIGTLGVIGPRRMHYERVLPIVDCTAKWVSRMLGGIH